MGVGGLRAIELLIGLWATVVADPVAPAAPSVRVVVAGACECPTPTDVQARLTELTAHGDDGVSPEVIKPPEQYAAVLACAAGGEVGVVLRHANGERIAERAFAAQGSCADLASAVAVIIAAWEADLDPRVSAEIDLPAASAVEPLPLPARPTAPIVAQTTTPALALALPSAPAGAGFSFGVGLLASLTGGQVVPGAMLEGALFPRQGHVGLAATVTATTTRDSSVGSLNDVAHWSRATLGLGPDLRFGRGAVQLDLQAAAVAALLHVEGSGLLAPSGDTGGQFGAAAGLRGAWAWGTSAVWAGAYLLAFPGQDRLVVNGASAEGRLPHIELQIASGLSLGRFP